MVDHRILEVDCVVRSHDHNSHQAVDDDRESVHGSLVGCNLLVEVDDDPSHPEDHIDRVVDCVDDSFWHQVVLLESKVAKRQLSIRVP